MDNAEFGKDFSTLEKWIKEESEWDIDAQLLGPTYFGAKTQTTVLIAFSSMKIYEFRKNIWLRIVPHVINDKCSALV